MLKIGEANEAFLAAQQVAPITIQRAVPNAAIRQSNAYFSSADIAFRDRDHAKAERDKIRSGRIPSKGGWRIYSSGPGIFIHQIINNMLGLRRRFDRVIIDPVIPTHLDGLKATFTYGPKTVTYMYRTEGKHTCGVKSMKVNGEELFGEPIENPYRAAGVAVQGLDFEALLQDGENIVDIILG